jgi:hypothetical protein
MSVYYSEISSFSYSALTQIVIFPFRHVKPAVLRPPLWSSGHSSWLQIWRPRVRFPTLPHFLTSSGSGSGSTQPRELRSYLNGKVATEINGRGDSLRWPHDTLHPQKLALTSPISAGHSVSINLVWGAHCMYLQSGMWYQKLSFSLYTFELINLFLVCIFCAAPVLSASLHHRSS